MLLMLQCYCLGGFGDIILRKCMESMEGGGAGGILIGLGSRGAGGGGWPVICCLDPYQKSNYEVRHCLKS